MSQCLDGLMPGDFVPPETPGVVYLRPWGRKNQEWTGQWRVVRVRDGVVEAAQFLPPAQQSEAIDD